MYQTPENFSNMIMNSDGEYLTGLWFEDSRDSFKHIINCEEKDLEIFKATSNFTKKNILNEDFLDEDILFSIRNSVDEVICEIKKKNIFDFSGDNIIEKAYTNGDCVMVIIDNVVELVWYGCCC
jgi:hypothetical protein